MTHVRPIGTMTLRFLASASAAAAALASAPLAPAPLAPAPLAAQPSVAVTLGSSFDTFRPTAGAAESRRTLVGAMRVDHPFAGGRGRLYYDLAAGNYDSPGDWSYQLHEAGGSYRVSGADSSGRRVFLTGSMMSRRNGDSWTSANYGAAGAGVNLELHPREGATLRAGYRADYRRFGDLSALTQLEHGAFASLLANFQTRTTLIVEGQVGAKRYEGVVYGDAPPVTVIDTVPSTTRGRGFGAGMGPGIRYTTVFSTATSERSSAGMLSVMGRLAQSLGDRTGIRVQATTRRTFGSLPPLLVSTPAGFFEDGVYDDPFASNAVVLETGITHVFANAAELAATAWWADKDYTSAVALDAEGAPRSGSPLRRDRVALGSVTWSHPLFAARTGALALTSEIGYRVLRHRSEDAFYNYASHAISIGISIGY